ncbi:ferrous iron transport protein A [Methanohalophilus levihalophilus]|uniref:FeoA family protein n=1 Tax=Methanohalophilus levihalophilus TaxID=1431282 RepID=UPI001AE17372|nr:ferrous iron transport protein A [Methanohalophilus levihalophilus]MBP2030702.1 ferrous iron transport protein A [Methanohalophilus levihalophilus]
MSGYTLDLLETGSNGRIIEVKGRGSARRRLLDMGMIPGAIVHITKKAPLGDPIDIKVKGYNLSLRKQESGLIVVETVE